MNTGEILKQYSKDFDHNKNVEKYSLMLFEKLKNIFPEIKKYDNEFDLELLKKGALLHDIGIYFEKIYNKDHNKAGAKFILENKPDDIKEEDLIFLCCLIRYHRKSLPNPKKHKLYSKLNDKDKIKLNRLASLIKLADGLDFGHLGLISDLKFEYSEKLNLLTLFLSGNIMLNASILKAINKKKDFFEFAYKVKLKLKGNL